jgi:hypothetical protein
MLHRMQLERVTNGAHPHERSQAEALYRAKKPELERAQLALGAGEPAAGDQGHFQSTGGRPANAGGCSGGRGRGKVLDALIQCDDHQALPVGLRVDVLIDLDTPEQYAGANRGAPKATLVQKDVSPVRAFTLR